MKFKILIIIAFILGLIGLVNAELIISPTTWDITVKKDVSQTFSVNLTNTFSFPIMDFEFKNITGFSFPNITIQPNQSVMVNYNVLQTSLIQYSKDMPVNFKYLVDIPVNPQIIHINITSSGYNPDFETIHEGDTVIWTNSDDVSHTVTCGSFDSEEIAPGGTYTQTFASVGTIDYQDFVLLWGGRLEVLNRSSPQRVNNPNYNKVVHINLNVYSDPTNLTFNVLDQNYTVDVTNKAEGMISIKNIGSLPAQKISLSSSKLWVTFDKNNFDLEVGQTTYVPFKITPILLSNNETNKTYELNLRANGLNTEGYNYTIYVFVPYQNVEDIDTDEGLLIFYDNWCRLHPTSPMCTGTLNSSGSGQIIYRDPEIPINLTATQVYAMLKRIQQIQDSNARTDNNVKETNDKINSELPEIKRLLNESVAKSGNAEEKWNTLSNTFWVCMIMGAIIIGTILIVNMAIKYQSKRNMMVRTKP